MPHDLDPDAPRVELIDLGDEFRTYQQRTEPDLALLAALHVRKARAFALWADVAGDGPLRHPLRGGAPSCHTARGQPKRADVSATGKLLTRLDATS